MESNKERIPSLFGSMVFNEQTMAQYISPGALQAWQACLQQEKPLNLDVANDIADGMKTWAIERGATHFTHWFQPMTGVTAEKHDSFLTPGSDGRALMEFSGKELVRGEPDASSFPSGGLRATFEARGYTAWDPTAFAFIKDGSLCIPTVFCSYSGQALDKKTPLLRSIEQVSKQAVRILRLFGDERTQKVIPQVGAEQEYFLIDKELFLQREDLKLTGRTLFGAKAPKGQELSDHYFGTIKPRVAAYMRDLDEELWKLGIPSRTKHNEVAPSQHEMAPVYTDANTACDHNQLTMEIMKKVAGRHNLVCLLHEKPFAGVNGSGKHNNWSLSTDSGENLFSPGKTPSQNAQFMLFLAAFVKGVDDYQELLRCSVAFAGNDHRLGAQEAPPAVISIYLGQELDAVIDAIVAGTDYTGVERGTLRIGVDVLPIIPCDTTDRNRTSPVAFTGNKFEFRMPGASQSITGPNTVLNTIMAEQLRQFAEQLEQAEDFNDCLHELIRSTFAAHRRIIFSGNGYDAGWLAEAARRGLANLDCAPKAIEAYMLPKNIELFTAHGIYSEEEIAARNEIHMEKYCHIINIEANTLVDMTQHAIFSAVSRYVSDLCQTVIRKEKIGVSSEVERALAGTLSELSNTLMQELVSLKTALATEPDGTPSERMWYHHDVIFARMNSTRAIIDQIEALTATDYWPYPIYSDLLFSV